MVMSMSQSCFKLLFHLHFNFSTCGEGLEPRLKLSCYMIGGVQISYLLYTSTTQPHEDGPLYHPIVTTISLGSHTLLDFYKSISAAEGLVREQANRVRQNRELSSVVTKYCAVH